MMKRASYLLVKSFNYQQESGKYYQTCNTQDQVVELYFMGNICMFLEDTLERDKGAELLNHTMKGIQVGENYLTDFMME